MRTILNSKFVIFGLVLVLALGALAGCTGNEPKADEKSKENVEKPAPKEEKPKEKAEEPKEDKLEGTVVLVGSTSVTPVAQKLGEAFMAINSGVKVDVQGVGSTAGVKAAHDGSANVGMASRSLKSGEKEWGLDEHVICYDGIAIVTHPSNPVKELTMDQVTSVFKGEVKNWKDLGGEDKEILVVSREAGSGTRGAFEGITKVQVKNSEGKKVSAVREDALIAEGNGAVKANVASKKYAIGYLSLSYMDETVKGLVIDGAEPTVEAILANKYMVSRPFLMLTKGELDKVTQAYLDFAFSAEGQDIVAEKNIPVK